MITTGSVPVSGTSFRLTALVVALVLGSAGVAVAHNPVVLDERDAIPSTAPEVPDGNVSMAFYGRLDHRWAFRSAQLDLRAGDALHVELLVPDKAPENALSRAQLPVLLLMEPDGRARVLHPTLREPLFEDFSRQHLLRLARFDAAAATGRYSIVVIGSAPARFIVVSGTQEEFGVPLERGSTASMAEVQRWYAGG